MWQTVFSSPRIEAVLRPCLGHDSQGRERVQEGEGARPDHRACWKSQRLHLVEWLYSGHRLNEQMMLPMQLTSIEYHTPHTTNKRAAARITARLNGCFGLRLIPVNEITMPTANYFCERADYGPRFGVQ
jgi:hypothetical protein